MATSRLEIDLRSIDRNIETLRAVLGGAGRGHAGGAHAPAHLCAVLKQDAYGLGAARIAKRLSASGAHGGHAGVDMFAVYSLDEARQLFEAVPRVPILVLMPVWSMDRNDPLYRCASDGRLHLVLHDHDQLDALNDLVARLGVSLPVHVQVDTGLSRGGLAPDAAAEMVRRVVSSQRLLLSGLMTHFSSPCNDAQATSDQAELFTRFMGEVTPVLREALVNGHNPPRQVGNHGERFLGCGGLGELCVHMANSCAVFRSRSLHATMARVGQALYGFALDDAQEGIALPAQAGEFEFLNEATSLESCVRWLSAPAHVQEIPTGWPVGYGSTWRAPKRMDGRPSRIALIPVGYADGYPRSLGGASEKRAVPGMGSSGGGPGWVGFTGRAFERRGNAEPDDAPSMLTRAPHAEPAPATRTLYAPVVGRVSMDQITVDVTDIPESYLRPSPTGGTGGGGNGGGWGEVELYGRDRTAPNYLPRLARAGGTITHELLCRISARVERVYRYPATNMAQSGIGQAGGFRASPLIAMGQ